MTRHIDFDGIQNFRDFGGYRTACGARMAKGRFYRSANHHRASDADLGRMAELGLRVIVDLRQPSEREREPSRRWDGFDAEVLENGEPQLAVDFYSELASSDLSAEWFYSHAVSFYERAPFEPRHVDLFRRYFRALAEADGAILVHCAAGKDRTGLACAFTHHIAGVHRDDLVEDYLLTNDEARLPARIAFIGALMEKNGLRPSDKALRVAVSVDAAWLEKAFAAIEARHGTLDAYLEQTLGVDAALRERLRARLLTSNVGR
jgi:protein tyrosine/serine phosphatase